MQIPYEISLAGITVAVQMKDDLLKTKGTIGEANYQEQMIYLNPDVAPIQTLQQTYIHEVTHWILFMMNEHDLRNNEKFVDVFAHFMHQALTSAKYKETAIEAD